MCASDLATHTQLRGQPVCLEVWEDFFNFPFLQKAGMTAPASPPVPSLGLHVLQVWLDPGPWNDQLTYVGILLLPGTSPPPQ